MDNNSLFNLVNKTTLCECGKNHPIKTQIIECNSIIYLSKLISKCPTKKCIIIHSEKTNNELLPIIDALKSYGIQVQTLVIECKSVFYEAHAKSCLQAIYDTEYIIGMGNDYIISLAKYIAYIKQLKLVIIPTKIESEIFATKYFKMNDGLSIQLVKSENPIAILLLDKIEINIPRCIASVISKQSRLCEVEINKKVFGESYCPYTMSTIKEKCNDIMHHININQTFTRKKLALNMIELSLISDIEEGDKYIYGYADVVAELICRRLPSVSLSDAIVVASLSVVTYLSRVFCIDLSKNINFPDLPNRFNVLMRLLKRDEKYILEILKPVQKKEKVLNYLHNTKYFSTQLSITANKYLQTMKEFKNTYFDLEKTHGKNVEFIKRNIFEDINYAVEIFNKKSFFDVLRDIGFLDK